MTPCYRAYKGDNVVIGSAYYIADAIGASPKTVMAEWAKSTIKGWTVKKVIKEIGVLRAGKVVEHDGKKWRQYDAVARVSSYSKASLISGVSLTKVHMALDEGLSPKETFPWRFKYLETEKDVIH